MNLLCFYTKKIRVLTYQSSNVIVPINSFVASAEAVVNAGFTVVFADCLLRDGAAYPDSVERLITPKTAAIIVVHLHGNAADLGTFTRLAQKYSLALIENSAQAHGAKWSGQNIGTFGDVATFSFFPGKNLGAMGDGGAICCKDEKLAQRCRMIANHGRVSKFAHEMIGRNSRLDALQAAILCIKLKHLEHWNEQRRQNAEFLHGLLASVEGVECIRPNDNVTSVYNNFVIRIQHRDSVKSRLSERGWVLAYITRILFPVQMHSLNARCTVIMPKLWWVNC